MQTVDWTGIRPWQGAKDLGFEEFCVQIARGEAAPDGSKFYRTGIQDAGVECFYVLPNGDEWGWQAKYFTSSPDSSQWSKLDNSVEKALDKHPKLTRLFICVPVDRPDARRDDQESMMDKWKKHMAKWEDWAEDRGREVSFEYWDSSELISRLQEPENRGMRYFWFNEEALTESWMQERLKERRRRVGPRYTPELSVAVPVEQSLNALVRSPEFQQGLRVLAAEGQQLYGRLQHVDKSDEVSNEADELARTIEEIATQLENAGSHPLKNLDPDLLLDRADSLRDSVRDKRLDIQRQSSESNPESKNKDGKHESTREEALRTWKHKLWEIERWLDKLRDVIDDQIPLTSNTGTLLLSGEAGVGKTHLLFDFAYRRLDNDQPTVLLLGEEFGSNDTLGKMTELLDLDCGQEELLGALDAAAQAANTKALLVIDALNETDDKTLWKTLLPKLISRLEKYPWISLAVSVRSDYLQTVLADHLRKQLPMVVHRGFEDVEFDALKSFCQYYGLTTPGIPPLNPEYQNPLFLKLMCKALKGKGETQLRPDVLPLSDLFTFFLDDVNDNLSEMDRLNYDPTEHRVQEAVNSLASKMAHNRRRSLPRQVVKDVLHEIHPESDWDQSLLKGLLSEGVLTETPVFTESGGRSEGIRFAFEWLGDHFIAKALLQETPPGSDERWPLVPDTSLGEILSGNHSLHAGLIRSLSILVPEATERELLEFDEGFAESKTVWEAFLQSIPWRRTTSFSEKTKELLRHNLSRPEMITEPGLESLMTISLQEDHPLGAEFLHTFLESLDMPIRDAVWTTFLHNSDRHQGAVRRLLDWCEKIPDPDNHVPSRENLGLILCWFLTASTREVRDRSTKALVKLWDGRPTEFNALVKRFASCDDPYVQERLYGCLYGVCLRCDNGDRVSQAARSVHETIFAEGSPLPHLLLRDYCRGILDRAIYLHPDIPLDSSTWTPPYDSDLPEIPAEEDLPHAGYPSSDAPIEVRARGKIYRSVMGHGDFARYIIGTNHSGPWQDILLDDPPDETFEEQYEAFVAGLSGGQRDLLDAWVEARRQQSVRSWLEQMEEWGPENGLTEEASEENRETDSPDPEERLADLKETLDEGEISTLEEVVIPYLDNPSIDKNPLDLSLLQRYIYWRVFDLGWDPDLHGEYDWRLDLLHNRGRGTQKPERIGKKYQWIGYDEVTAYLTDTYVFEKDAESYHGPWQLYRRDIDPSYVEQETAVEQKAPGIRSYWPPTGPEGWGPKLTDEDWLERESDFPPVREIIVQKDDHGTRWLNLNGMYRWKQPVPPEKEPVDEIYRDVFYILRGYLVRDEDYETVISWAKDQDFSGRWMPEAHDLHNVYLGEFLWSEPYNYHRGDVFRFEDWKTTTLGEKEFPAPVHVPIDHYAWEEEYDHSIEERVDLYTPSRWLADEMGLTWSGRGSTFLDDTERLAAFDPSFALDAPSGLLIREDEFLEFLDDRNLRVFWTVQGEKNLIGIPRETNLGWLAINIVAELEDGHEVLEHWTVERHKR